MKYETIMIPNLTEAQAAICKIIWEAESNSELQQYFDDSKSQEEFNEKAAILDLMKMTVQDAEVNTEEDCAEVNAMLAKF